MQLRKPQLASILEHLPRHLFRARLDWSLHVGDRRDMVTRLDDIRRQAKVRGAEGPRGRELSCNE